MGIRWYDYVSYIEYTSKLVVTRMYYINNKMGKIRFKWFITTAYIKQQQQQQLSHLSQVFGVDYMNQKRITPDQTHGSAFSNHYYQAIWFH